MKDAALKVMSQKLWLCRVEPRNLQFSELSGVSCWPWPLGLILRSRAATPLEVLLPPEMG